MCSFSPHFFANFPASAFSFAKNLLNYKETRKTRESCGDSLTSFKQRLFALLQPSRAGDKASRLFSILLMGLIFLNTGIVFAYTFPLSAARLGHFRLIEVLSICIFTLEYLLRLWTADLVYPSLSPTRARLRYSRTPLAIVDLLAILPFYLTLLPPFDLTALRVLRLLRLFQLFKLSRYTSSLFLILRVIRKKSAQLLSSMAVVFILILISSLIMYAVENPAQPLVFSNAFSGMWWAVSTLTTVGYGDIYPITVLGKLVASIIALLGIGLLAVPTAIISSGFIEQSGKRSDGFHSEGRYCPHCGKRLR